MFHYSILAPVTVALITFQGSDVKKNPAVFFIFMQAEIYRVWAPGE